MNWPRAAGGFGVALLAHAFTLLLLSLGLFGGDDALGTWLIVALVGQGAVFVGCVTAGVIAINRGDLGFGVGLLVGWAVGVMVVPFAGFGLCLVALDSS